MTGVSTESSRPLTDRVRYKRNVFWMAVDKCFMLGVSFITGIVVARYLGPADMGIWGYAVSLSAMLAVLGTLGIEQVAIRDLVADESSRPKLLGSAIGLRVAGGTVAFVLLALIGLLSDDANIRALLLLLGATHLFLAFEAYDYLFQARVQARHGVVVRVIWQGCLGAGKLYLVYVGAGLVWFGVVTLAAAMLQAVLYVLVGRVAAGVRPGRLRFSPANSRYLLGQSWPLLLSGIATTAYLQLDRVMLMHFEDASVVGNYTVASTLAIASVFLLSVMTQALYPAVLRARDVTRALYEKRLVQLYSATIWLALLIGVGLVASAPALVPLLLGAEYQSASRMLQVMSALGIFSAITLVSSFWLLAERLQRFSFYRNVFGLAANIVLNLVLIPAFGAIGAAIASIVARAMATVGFMIMFPALRGQLRLIGRALDPRSMAST